ncbi:MAG: tetratricopeptide repeat protein [Candidatus Neomarinimicrobiota bacterium]
MKTRLILKFIIAINIGLINASDFNEQEIALNHFMQGEFLMNQGNYALAILEFQDAIALDPNAATIHISIADGYRRIGKIVHAENHLKIALDLDSEENEALEMLGQLYLAQQRYIDSKGIFVQLHNLYPNNIDYLYTLADLAKMNKEWNLAIDYYIRGYEINSMATTGVEQALQIAITISNFKRAEEICSLLLIENPSDIEILETMKDLTLFNGNYEKSLEILNELEKINGQTNALLIQKSALYEELDQVDMALQMTYIAFDNDSLDIEVLHRLVTLLISRNKNEEAILYNQKIIDYHPNDSRGFINNAVMAMSSKKPDEAILALSPHSSKFENDFTVQYLLGTAYYQIKDYDNSQIYLSKALSIYPQSRNVKHNLALIYDSIGEWSQSDQLYLDLISTDSTDAQAYNNYAYSLVERNENMELALELAQNAIRIEPKSAAYLDTIGWIYFKMDLYDKALHYIRESLSIDESNKTIQNHLNQVIKTKTKLHTNNIQQVEN